MRSKLCPLLAAVGAIALSGCATAPSETSLQERGLAALSEAELVAFYQREQTIAWSSVQGGEGTAVYRNDGSAVVDWGSGQDEGTWRIVEGQFCLTLNTIADGEERCFTQYQTGDNEYQLFKSDGAYNATVSYL